MNHKCCDTQRLLWKVNFPWFLLLLIFASRASSELSNGGDSTQVNQVENNMDLATNAHSSSDTKSPHDSHDDIVAAFEHSQHHHGHEQQVASHLSEKRNADGSLPNGDEPGMVENHKFEGSVEEDSQEEEMSAEEEQSGDERDYGVHYHIHETRQHQQVKGETREGGSGGDEEIDDKGHEENHSSAEDGSGDDLGVEEVHVHQGEPLHFETHHSSDNKGVESDWEHFHLHLHSDQESGDLFGFGTDEEPEDDDKVDSHSAEGASPDGHKETLHIHRRVHSINRNHASEQPRDTDHAHRHKDETSDSEGSDERENSGDGAEKLSNQRELHRNHEIGVGEQDTVHMHFHGKENIDHSGEDASGDSESDDGQEGKHQVHQAVRQASVDKMPKHNAENHHHVHIHHKHKTPEQLSTAGSTTEAVTKSPPTEAVTKSPPTEAVTKSPLTEVTEPKEEEGTPEGQDADIYIDENNEPDEELKQVKMVDKVVDPDEEIVAHLRTKEVGNLAEGRPGSRRLLQVEEHKVICFHHNRPISNGAIVYIRAECRLCQCLAGKLQCEAKGAKCPNGKSVHCLLERGGMVKDGDRHFDGCNSCLCRSGKLLCTHVRCESSGYNYTNYARAPENVGLDRGKDPCMECDHEPISPVCGSNWKTYRSLCHAYLCAGLRMEDLQMGTCEDLDPCKNHQCRGKDEICIANQQAPCLAVETRAGKIVECTQYECVAIKESCPRVKEPDDVLCGIDGKTYQSACDLVSNSVLLAYEGSCRRECSDGKYQVCGVDAVTFESPCQANLYNQYIDYQGPCETFAARPDVIIQEHGPDLYENCRCSRLDREKRCPALHCQQAVTPQGTCCPVCGAALSIHLDVAVHDMVDLLVVKPSQNLNSLDAVYTALANLQDVITLETCQISVDLVDTHDIVSTFVPKKLNYLQLCKDAARNTVQLINSKTDGLDPYQALLASAVLVESEDVSAEGVKSRMRRSGHHEHEPIFPNNTSAAVAETKVHISCFLPFVLFSTMAYEIN